MKRSRTSAFRGLPRTVVALGLVSFWTDLSSEMIYPLLPVFLAEVLGAGAIALGTIEGVAETTAAVFKIGSGYWADRVRRRKPLVVGGYALSGSMRPLIGLVTAWPMVVALRFGDRIGKGLRTSPRDALIADATAPERRGAAFGLHRAMDHAGAVAGPLVAASLLLLPGMTLRRVFLLAAVPALIVVLVLVFGVHEDRRPVPSMTRGGVGTGSGAAWGEMGAPFHRLVVAMGIFALGNSTDAFILLRLSDAGIAAAAVAVLWALHSLVKLVANLYGGQLSDHISRRRLVMVGWAIYAVVYLGFGRVSSVPVLIAIFLMYGLYFGLTEPVERAWVAALAPERHRGAAFGLYHGVTGLVALPASLLFGAVYQGVGPAAAFGMGAALAAVATAALFRVPSDLPG